MEPENLTLRVLIEMRDEMRGMRDEMRTMNTQLASIDTRMGVIETRTGVMEARMGVVESTLVESAEQIRILARTASVGIRGRRAHARRLDDLEHRVAKLEQKPGT